MQVDDQQVDVRLMTNLLVVFTVQSVMRHISMLSHLVDDFQVLPSYLHFRPCSDIILSV